MLPTKYQGMVLSRLCGWFSVVQCRLFTREGNERCFLPSLDDFRKGFLIFLSTPTEEEVEEKGMT